MFQESADNVLRYTSLFLLPVSRKVPEEDAIYLCEGNPPFLAVNVRVAA
jgi:hypothetical protein